MSETTAESVIAVGDAVSGPFCNCALDINFPLLNAIVVRTEKVIVLYIRNSLGFG